MSHTVYLQTPTPLIEGKTYTLEFPGVNTTTPAHVFTHDTKLNRCEAIHTHHTGYRPDDPYKRAFVSLWLGTGGPSTHKGPGTFELLDAPGKPVFTGKVERALALDPNGKVRVGKNLSGTAVYAMDFSAFSTPGNYAVHVPGVGVSYPVTIGGKVWEAPFKAPTEGVLTQRSGIAVGPPLTSFISPERPSPRRRRQSI